MLIFSLFSFVPVFDVFETWNAWAMFCWISRWLFMIWWLLCMIDQIHEIRFSWLHTKKQYLSFVEWIAWQVTCPLHLLGRCTWQARGIYKLQWTRLLWASKKHIKNKNDQDSMEGTRVFLLFIWRYHPDVCGWNTWMAAILDLIQILSCFVK